MTNASRLGKVALLLLLCATTAGGFLWLPPARQFMNPALARIVVFHVPCAIVADLASAVAGWYAIAYLRKRSLGDDVKSSASFGLALLFCLLTTVTGAVFAKVQWGQYWNWDPREKTIFMLLLIYLAYFALRAAFSDARRRAAVSAAYALFGVAAVPFLTYILPNSTDLTLHPKGVITTQGGLDPAYKLVLWSGVLGLSLVYLWAFRLHVALGEIGLRLDRRARAHSGRAAIAPVVVQTRPVEAEARR
jgi:heme exporter protein C